MSKDVSHLLSRSNLDEVQLDLIISNTHVLFRVGRGLTRAMWEQEVREVVVAQATYNLLQAWIGYFRSHCEGGCSMGNEQSVGLCHLRLTATHVSETPENRLDINHIPPE